MSAPSSSRRAGSRLLVAAGLVSVPVGLLTQFFPPASDPALWGYPFDHTTHVIVALVLVVAHLLKAAGFVVGLAPLGGPVVRWSMWIAALGFTLLAICEGVSGTMFGVPLGQPATVTLDNGYGVGSMLFAVPSMVGGAVIARRKLLEGPGRWSVFLSGAFMIFVVTPALIMGRGPAAYLALTAWSLFYLWIGHALGRTESREST